MTYSSIFKPELFSNQLILVTGGGSGIGRCIAHELACLGANVFICGRTEEKLKNVVEEIQSSGGKADYATCDIREEEQVKALVQTIKERHGVIHGLVNNAGGQFPAPLEAISKNGWDAVINNNLNGTFLMTKEVVLQSMKATGGSIVNILATNQNGMPMMAHSGAARAGVENLTKTAAIEWAQYKIRVNGISPGIIISSGLDTYDPIFRKNLERVLPMMPLKRFGTESEVSAAVCFLLSPAANYISGVNLPVDGAFHMCGHMAAPVNSEPNEEYQGFSE